MATHTETFDYVEHADIQAMSAGTIFKTKSDRVFHIHHDDIFLDTIRVIIVDAHRNTVIQGILEPDSEIYPLPIQIIHAP